MVSLPVSHPSPHSAGFPGRGRITRFAGRVAEFFEILGAAVRVSQAVESRRDADPVDLNKLGIDGPLPRSW